jgi:hypothetical protein
MAEINTESLGLYVPLIDDRSENQIYQAAQNVVASRSNGQLNDFSDSNPLGVLLRSQAFAASEILYRVNKLPLALAVKLLELTGTVRRLGSKAQVLLTFSLSAPRSTPFTVPLGFEVVDRSGQFSFFTEAVLTIPAGAAFGSVSALAKEVGNRYNLPAFTVNQITQPLAFLASVTNAEPSQGGSEAETVESAIERGLIALRSRNAVSALDFEQKAQDLMGEGSRCKAIGLLAADRITEQAGAVHLFLLSATGEPANPALINRVFAEVSKSVLLGVSLYVSPMDLLPVSANIIARIIPGSDPAIVADELWTAYVDYLSPKAYEPGETLLIKELEHQLRFVTGLEYIEEVTLNGLGLNVPMPSDYTLPSAYSLRIQLVDDKGNTFDTSRGAGEIVGFGEPI